MESVNLTVGFDETFNQPNQWRLNRLCKCVCVQNICKGCIIQRKQSSAKTKYEFIYSLDEKRLSLRSISQTEKKVADEKNQH